MCLFSGILKENRKNFVSIFEIVFDGIESGLVSFSLRMVYDDYVMHISLGYVLYRQMDLHIDHNI